LQIVLVRRLFPMSIENQLHDTNAAQIQAGMTIGPAFATMRDLVLKHGRCYNPKPLPPGRRQSRFRLCYSNTLGAARTRKYIYVEGFALRLGTWGLPLLHAWVTDPQLVAFFIVVACAATLFKSGHGEINDAAEAAIALKPFAGEFAR